MNVRIGILGCANIARRYAIQAFQNTGNTEVVSIASRAPEKAKAWAEEWGIKKSESYDALIQNPEIDAVYIPLPISLHKEWVVKAARAKKHVICEKSLAESLASAKEIVDACRKNNVVLYENFMCDFHPQHKKVRSLMQEGEIGEPFLFEGHFGFPPLDDKDNFRYSKDLGGGALNDAGAYTIFMARRAFGEEPIQVHAKLFVDKKRGVDMKGSAELVFPNEKIAHLAWSFNSAYQNNYSVWGEKGILRVERSYSIPPDMKPNITITTNDGKEKTETQVNAPAANHFELIFKDFANTILRNDTQKREEKYKDILAQAKVLETIRNAS